MAGDSRVLMDHNMEIGVTPAQVSCAALLAMERTEQKKKQRRNDRLRGSLRWQNMVEEAGMLMMSRTR